MICLNCRSEEYLVIYTEEYPCSHCGEDITIEFCTCTECGALWRAVDGKIIEESIVTTDDLIRGLTPINDYITRTEEDMTEEEKEFMKKIEAEILKHENLDSENVSMSDIIHRCLKCETIADEIKPGFFECPACKFSWEVFKFE